jgi:DNA-binding IclR family transcriptional regulator
MSSVESNSRSVLERAFRVLTAFAPRDSRLSLTELSRRTGLPKGSLHRMAAQLVTVGALERVEDRYQLGLRMFEIARMVPVQLRLREVMLPFMEDLYEATHETVHLGVLRDTEVIYIDRIAGHRQVYCPTRVGGRMPAHCTSLGKAMLAFSGPEVLEKVLADGLPALSPHTVTEPRVLRQQIERARTDGVAYDNEESVRGVICVGAPVLHHHDVVAALSVTGPKARLNPRRLAPAVRTAALGASRALSRVRLA